VTRGRGQDLLLQALPWVRSRIRGTRLVLAGPTFDRPKDLAYEAELRGIAVELGIAAELTFAGAVPNIADAYAAADVVVNPARTPESFGRVACEALVAGCPVVATRVGAAEEVLAGLPGVELVPPDQPAPLATALVAALTDPTASARAREGGDRVAQRYSPRRSLVAFQGAVDRAMGDHARSRPASSRRRPSAA
jgi:glycosyltransferase involved in cell wall biosynthesis